MEVLEVAGGDDLAQVLLDRLGRMSWGMGRKLGVFWDKVEGKLEIWLG